MRDSFVFYRGFFKAIKKLKNDADRLALYDAITAYALDGIVPEDDETGLVSALMETIIPQIDANNKKYENGKKGGAPKGNSNASKGQNNQKQPNSTKNNQKQPNVNVNVNVNDNVNVNENDNDNVNVNENVNVPDSGDPLSLSSSIVSYLNAKTGSSYLPNEETDELIDDLIGVGYTEEDLKAVVDKKTAEWLNDPKMRGYLRPSTLFGSKFGEYLSAPEPLSVQTEKQTERDRARLIREREEAQKELAQLLIDQERVEEDAGVTSDEWGRLEDRKELLRVRIESIGKRVT